MENKVSYGSNSPTPKSYTFEVIIGAILIFVLVFVTTVAFVYERRRNICYNNPSPWCYEDWECTDVPESDPNRYPARLSQQIAQGCYLTSSGTRSPSCTNAWGIT